MPKICSRCGRIREKNHMCDLVLLSNNRAVHADRVDDPEGDIRADIQNGKVRVIRRLLKKRSHGS